jgi:hypothetical protein
MTRDTSRPNTRRELLRLGALAVLSFHGVRRSALAQGTPGAKPIKIGTIGAGRMGGTLRNPLGEGRSPRHVLIA